MYTVIVYGTSWFVLARVYNKVVCLRCAVRFSESFRGTRTLHAGERAYPCPVRARADSGLREGHDKFRKSFRSSSSHCVPVDTQTAHTWALLVVAVVTTHYIIYLYIYMYVYTSHVCMSTHTIREMTRTRLTTG